MSEEEFTTAQDSLVNEYTAGPISMYKHFHQLYKEIESHHYNFKRRSDECLALCNIKKQDFINNYKVS